MIKRALSVILALLVVISIVPIAMAETEYNYTVKTEFYGYDSAADEWQPVTTASGGETLKMRVSVSTNFVSGPANFLLAYDKSVLSADLPENGSSTEFEKNPDKKFFAYNDVQQVRGAHGTNAANQQFGYGNITQEEFEKYGFIVGSITTYGCIQYDGSDWLFEIDMTVLKGCKGKTFECFILPKTVQTMSNKRGMVNFPYAPEVSNDLTTISAAFNWYDGSPVVQASQISVIANTMVPEFYNVTFNANGGAFADGEEKNEISVESYEEIIAPEAPVKQGYTFAGWDEEIPSVMPENDLAFNAQWEANGYTVAFDANGGLFADGNEKISVDFDYDTDIIFSESPEKQGYIFAGWAESENGEIIDSLGKMDSTEGKHFYAQWIAADDVAYTVETYTMNPDGTYVLVTTGNTGTTGETANAAVSVQEGFELNAEKSVTSGVIAADGSLVLKVYYDRKTYKLTSVVNGVQTTTEYLYGADVDDPATPFVQGYTFKGWDGEVPATMPAKNVTVNAMFMVAATVKIKNNPGSRTINYGETLHLTAVTANMPVGAYVKWYVEGSGVSVRQNANDSTCDITSTGSGTVTVTAKVVDKNGNPILRDGGEISDSQKVTSNAGIWQKIVSFFKNLFRANRTIIQAFKVF